ncbi:hypothetical protein [Candidatus Berkiella aquae]|nr:hypothetical protein [Candidatus Berkiella aquae]MCS5712154.1 hypothetical protein [Candidatus Berkiella aquae]
MSNEQLKNSCLSQERTQEVVLMTLFKLNERQMPQDDILRNVTDLLSELEKLTVYKNIEQVEKHELEQFNQDFILNKESYFAKLIRKDKLKATLEHLIDSLIKHQMSKHIIEGKIANRRYHAAKRFKTIFISESCHPIDTPSQRKGLHHGIHLIHQIHALIQLRENSVKIILHCQSMIVDSRRFHTSNLIQSLIEMRRYPLIFFKGMTSENQSLFIKEYIKIREDEIVQTTTVDIKIQSEIQHNDIKQERKMDSMLVRYRVEAAYRPILQKWYDDKDRIKSSALQKVKVLGEKTKNRYVNIAAEDEVCQKHLEDFENNELVKTSLSKHLALTRKQTIEIEKEKKKLKECEQQISELVTKADRKKVLTNLEREDLTSLLSEFDETMLEQISNDHVTLVNNLKLKK